MAQDYAKNRAVALAKKKAKDYEIFGSRGDAARTGMEQGRMDQMGNAYKKGGKAMEYKHNVEHVKQHAAGHMHEQEKVAKHYGNEGHKMHHDHVKAMCGGGMSKGKQK
jgi:hypothetical protein